MTSAKALPPMTTPPFASETESILNTLNSSGVIQVNGLKSSAPALLLAGLGERNQGALIIISDDFQKSQDLCRDVAAYHKILHPNAAIIELLTLPPLPRLAYRQTLRSGRIERERIVTLAKINNLKNFLCFTTIAAYCDRLPEPQRFFNNFFRLEWSQTIDREKLFLRLDKSGYVRVPVVDEPGDYSVRGGVIDIFSPLHAEPRRLDFFGDEIESIRAFEPLTQLSRKDELDSIEIGPAREVLPPSDLSPAKKRIRECFVELNDSEIALAPALAELEQSPNRPGFESLIPAFSDDWHSLADFFPNKSATVFIDTFALKEQLEDLNQQLSEGYERSLSEKNWLSPRQPTCCPRKKHCAAPANGELFSSTSPHCIRKRVSCIHQPNR